VRSHGGVQRRAARTEACSFGVVLPANVSHKFRHAIPVIVWRLESVLSYQPPWREDHEIHCSSAEYRLIYPSIADLQVRTVKIEGSG
jgi:hypothetical protein